MEPKGKTKLLIEAMQAQPDKALWTPDECRKIMELEGSALTAQLGGALRREWLYKHALGGRHVAYSLHPQEEEETATEPMPFNAALWADGDLVLMNVELNADGTSVTLGPDQVRQLCRLLHGQGPEA